MSILFEPPYHVVLPILVGAILACVIWHLRGWKLTRSSHNAQLRREVARHVQKHVSARSHPSTAVPKDELSRNVRRHLAHRDLRHQARPQTVRRSLR